MGSTKRPVDEKVGEIKGGPVKHDCSNDFMGTSPRFEYSNDAPLNSSCQCTANEHSGDEQPRGPVRSFKTNDTGCHRPHGKLACSANVEKPRPKGNGDRKAGENEWSHRRQGKREILCVAKCAAKEGLIGSKSFIKAVYRRTRRCDHNHNAPGNHCQDYGKKGALKCLSESTQTQDQARSWRRC